MFVCLSSLVSLAGVGIPVRAPEKTTAGENKLWSQDQSGLGLLQTSLMQYGGIEL